MNISRHDANRQWQYAPCMQHTGFEASLAAVRLGLGPSSCSGTNRRRRSCCSSSSSSTHARTHARSHARTHTRTHAHTHSQSARSRPLKQQNNTASGENSTFTAFVCGQQHQSVSSPLRPNFVHKYHHALEPKQRKLVCFLPEAASSSGPSQHARATSGKTPEREDCFPGLTYLTWKSTNEICSFISYVPIISSSFSVSKIKISQ